MISDSYISFSTQYSISTRTTKPSISKASSKNSNSNNGSSLITKTQQTESTKSSSRVYRTKQFSHQKVEYVRKQDKNTLQNI